MRAVVHAHGGSIEVTSNPGKDRNSPFASPKHNSTSISFLFLPFKKEIFGQSRGNPFLLLCAHRFLMPAPEVKGESACGVEAFIFENRCGWPQGPFGVLLAEEATVAVIFKEPGE